MIQPVSKRRWLEKTYHSSRKWFQSPERKAEEDSEIEEESLNDNASSRNENSEAQVSIQNGLGDNIQNLREIYQQLLADVNRYNQEAEDELEDVLRARQARPDHLE